MDTKLGKPLVHCNKEETWIKAQFIQRYCILKNQYIGLGAEETLKSECAIVIVAIEHSENYGLYKTGE
jgi:hypothetical protein